MSYGGGEYGPCLCGDHMLDHTDGQNGACSKCSCNGWKSANVMTPPKEPSEWAMRQAESVLNTYTRSGETDLHNIARALDAAREKGRGAQAMKPRAAGKCRHMDPDSMIWFDAGRWCPCGAIQMMEWDDKKKEFVSGRWRRPSGKKL